MTRMSTWRLVAVALLSLVVVSLPAAGWTRDPQVEASAKALQKQARHDALTLDFKSAQAKLEKALSQCGAGDCSPALQARLHRDLGVVQIEGKLSPKWATHFAEAQSLDPTVAFDPDQRTKELEGAWERARTEGRAVAAPSAAAGAPPSARPAPTPVAPPARPSAPAKPAAAAISTPSAATHTQGPTGACVVYDTVTRVFSCKNVPERSCTGAFKPNQACGSSTLDPTAKRDAWGEGLDQYLEKNPSKVPSTRDFCLQGCARAKCARFQGAGAVNATNASAAERCTGFCAAECDRNPRAYR